MLDSIDFFLKQWPEMWTALFITFFLLGLTYARFAWYSYAAQLNEAMKDRKCLLVERDAAQSRRQQRMLPNYTSQKLLTSEGTTSNSQRSPLRGVVPGLVPTGSRSKSRRNGRNSYNEVELSSQPVTEDDQVGVAVAPPEPTSTSNPWVDYRKGDHRI